MPLVPSSSVAAVFTKSTGSWRDHCAIVLGFSSGEENSTVEQDRQQPDHADRDAQPL